LLANVDAMVKTITPMMRSGRIGALKQPNILGEDDGRPFVEPWAHLLDVRSTYGFSGAPCFVEMPMIVSGEGGPVISSHIALLGMIVSHMQANYSGIAVAVRAEEIRELLEKNDVLVKWRESKEKAAQETAKRQRKVGAAVLDATPSSTVDRTADLLGRLTKVPKKEADETHRKHQS
jgi:hypothetical protein